MSKDSTMPYQGDAGKQRPNNPNQIAPPWQEGKTRPITAPTTATDPISQPSVYGGGKKGTQ